MSLGVAFVFSQLVLYALSLDSFNSSFSFIIDDVRETTFMINGVVFHFVRHINKVTFQSNTIANDTSHTTSI